MALPDAFQPLDALDDVPNKTSVDVFGLVVDTLPTARTGGTSFQATLGIRDGTHSRDTKIKFFFNKAEDFDMPDEGDAVIVRNVHKGLYNGQLVLTSKAYITEMVIFAVADMPDSVFASPENTGFPASAIRRYPKANKHPVDEAEEIHAAALWQWALKSGLPVADRIRNRSQAQAGPRPQTVVMVAPSKKLSLVKDMRGGNFYDVVGEIFKIFTRDEKSISLYITDYTMNSQLYSYMARDDGDQQWETFPEGKYTLQITVWGRSAQVIHEKAMLGSFVSLRNIRAVYQDATNCLEAKLHEDRDFPDRVYAHVLDESHPLVRELIVRREEFRATRTKADAGKSKKKRKRKQKKEKEREQALAKPAASDPFLGAHRADENRHIIAAFGDKPLHSLHSVLNSPQLLGCAPDGHMTYPFMLAKFRARVRVIDFYPPKLEDFARPLDDAEFNNCRTREDRAYPAPQWEWAFFLLVEDANDSKKERIKLLVAGPEAEYLLRLTASDLRKDVTNFKALRDKMFVLWGEVEEDKNKGLLGTGKVPKNKPFVCCIQEYGVRVEGLETDWTRMHKMFSTTIKD